MAWRGLMGAVTAGHAFAVKEDVFALESGRRDRFPQPRRAPVERAVGRQVSVRLAHAVAVALIGIGVAVCAGEVPAKADYGSQLSIAEVFELQKTDPEISGYHSAPTA